MKVINKGFKYKYMKDLKEGQLFAFLSDLRESRDEVYCCVKVPDEKLNDGCYELFRFSEREVIPVKKENFPHEPLVFYSPEDMLVLFGASEELQGIIEEWEC